MKNTKVTPSSQVDTFLPSFVNQQYSDFVNFMSKAAESEERIGFGQDILQNLQKYRNFDTYADKIVQFGTLKGNTGENDNELTLVDGYGFPQENGVILIDDEVILYTTRENNTLYGVQRGASGTTVLPTLRSSGTYLRTTPEAHSNGSEVVNLSVLFLVAMLENIHQSYTPNIEWERVNEDVNRSSLLQNIKDFFASKGSNFGIASLFKILFGRNNVSVEYPGDKMIKPSESTWTDTPILRVVPFPEILSDPSKPYTTPDKLIGSEVTIRSYNDDRIHGRGVCDYVSRYPFESEVQFELYMNEDSVSGDFPLNPATTLTRVLERTGTNNDLIDVFTVTVESTLGFPNSGVIFIDNEGIYYTAKTNNQFLNCTRGYISIETQHTNGSDVYGPYYLSGTVTIDGVDRTSYSWPLNLVKRVDVKDGGCLVSTSSSLFVDGPGLDDPGNQILESLVENLDDDLMTQTNTMPNMAWNGQYSDGIDSIYFNEDRVLVSTSTFPDYQIGYFSTDNSVGPEMKGVDAIYQVPRKQKDNTERFGKGSGIIGVAVDGVPFYSNESPDFVASGAITKINVMNQGGGYINPTVVISSGSSTAEAVVGRNGKIISIDITSNDGYYTTPTARISSGEGEYFDVSFDNYGRLTSVALQSGGQYYNDVPAMVLVDSSGRGRGALITCSISNGTIQSVDIINPGIDYNVATTELRAIPVGSGAELEVEVERFIFDRPGQVRFNSAWEFDSGNGFLYEDEDGVRSRFGYVGIPNELTTRLGDNLQGGSHSPIIGWAFDGNPIYGPFGYANGVDDTEGFQKQFTAYVLLSDRSDIVATGGTGPALLPPDEGTYPMGTFIEDYKYDPIAAAIRGGRIKAENDDYIMTELDEYLRYQTEIPGVLGPNNGKVCNTPEFPKELYPDGVFVYFTSTFGEEMQFPYIIGGDFHNRPVSQNLTVIDRTNKITPQNNNYGSFDVTPVEVNIENLSRYRNNILSSTKDEVKLDIVSVKTGSLKDIIVENGNPANSAVGDILFFDDEDMDGTGAAAVVSKVEGKEISDSQGYDIVTRTIGHKQRLNLEFDSRDLTFFKDMTISTETGSVGNVLNYNYDNKYLDIYVSTPRLFQFGDKFYDAKDHLIEIPTDASDINVYSDTIGGTSTFISYNQPGDNEASPGDLWWSSFNGRMYIYFDDGDSAQWVTAQPLGMRPFVGASDLGSGNTEATTQSWASPQSDTSVSMSSTAPSSRADGTPNQKGDLWWSTHTGNLYLWNTDNFDGITFDGTSEWVATDPTAVVTTEGVSDDFQYYTIPTGSPAEYSQSVRVLISEASPLEMDDGSDLVAGVLWWSPLNGKMYIYYTDTDSSQWVICNPISSLSSKWGLNTIPSGDGGEIPNFISLLPYSREDEIVWFESIKHFLIGDSVEFVTGAPGVESLKEVAEISKFGENTQVILIRGENPVTIPQGTEVINESRSLYTITTSEPHGLRVGDEVFISGSTQEKLNGRHEIVEGGVVVPASATSEVTNGSVTTVAVVNPGAFYAEDVLVQFIGGNGIGGYGIAKTSGLDSGGQIIEIDIVNGGINYDSNPDVVFPDINTINSFSFYTTDTLAPESGIKYATSSESVSSTINDVELLSGGIDYADIPRIIGVRKRMVDRAQFRLGITGQTVTSVNVFDGGARYTNPQAFIYDVTGSGSGAKATVTVEGEQVTGITITNPGQNYVEPYLRILETDGKFIATTEDIGKLVALDVINPGRTISADISLKPEIQIETRFVLKSIDGKPLSFLQGQVVYQGIDTHRFNESIVVSWDNQRQILTVRQLNGIIRENQEIYNENGSSGIIIVDGSTFAQVEVDGISSPRGKFITEQSQLSSIDAVVQDSDYYQWFSYVIKAPLQQVEYDTFVKQLIHPAGFAMFSNVEVDEGVSSPFNVEDIVITIDSPLSLSTESGLLIYTESGTALVGDTSFTIAETRF